jgi:hypothetical protein
MKNLVIFCALTLVVSACASNKSPDAAQVPLFSCDSKEVTCSPTDARVCFTWCEKGEMVRSATPELDVCGGRDACEVECTEVQE